MVVAGSVEQRYRRLFDRHSRQVYAYCRRRTDAQTAADAAAETFLVAWRRLDDIPDGDAELGWLYGVARKVLANEYRRNRRSRRLLARIGENDPDPAPTPEMVVVRRERDSIMLAALARLTPDDQEVLRLAWWEEIPHVEIAAVMGCSRQAVSQRIHRAALRAAKEYRRLDHDHTVSGTPRQLRGGETT